MEQRPQAAGNFLLQRRDARHDGLHRLRGLILVEVACHGDFVAHGVLLVIDPGVGRVGQHLAGEIGLHILRKGHVLGVPQLAVRHGLALLQNGLSVLAQQRALHRDFRVAEGLGVKDFALAVDFVLFAVYRAVLERAIGLNDQATAQVGDVVALGADRLAPGLIAVAGVDQLHLAGAVGGLVLAQHPDIGGYASVHKLVGGQLHDGVQPVVFQDVAADLAGAAARVAGEQRRTVLDDCHLALRRQLRKAVQHEQLLAVGNFRQARREPAQLALRGLRLHRLLLPLPVDAKGRVADAVLEGVAGKLVVGKGVAKPHVVRVAAADHHVRLGDGKGGRVELLAETADGHVGVQLVDALLHAGEHLAGAHGHVYKDAVFDTNEYPGHRRAEAGNIKKSRAFVVPPVIPAEL